MKIRLRCTARKLQALGPLPCCPGPGLDLGGFAWNATTVHLPSPLVVKYAQDFVQNFRIFGRTCFATKKGEGHAALG